ncbi:LLM class flavin-dependent oxidoreductase [Sediminibacterium soli]|uniref:LLM class flavin-dependent oxidoreductase n=1 Tax=Sediminibacterium soli TaxID=2698829 RepID=UPI00137A0A7C|nr:LLM class flavin-dependent oxidoreductase [Sediminibacterium soli]NCI46585.1 LLM class flavin-dependent oxidoreductase [Sediminibacterium soli]
MQKKLSEIPFSVLDLATIIEGDGSPGPAFARSLSFARQAESLGYTRYWFAEHHNMESVASAATAVLAGYVASGTHTIRVGSGGVMLPNHAPLVIAEQFGTLASLYPNRIDLGIGRAPGTDPVTSHALRRNLTGDVNQFPNDVIELLNYLGDRDPEAKIRAIPGENTHVPVWLLGSSTFSAQLAGMLGLPFAFASHFAPAQLMDAMAVYRQHFKPSAFLQQPYAMACVNVIAAESDEEAASMATSFYQLALGLFRNDRRPLPPPVASMDDIWTEREKLGVMQMTAYSFLGTTDTLQKQLQSFLDTTGVDEIMTASHIYSVEKKQRSMELVAQLFKKRDQAAAVQ